MKDYTRIRELRRLLDKTLFDVSAATDMSFSELNRLERGKKMRILNAQKRAAVNEWMEKAEKTLEKRERKNGRVHAS